MVDDQHDVPPPSEPGLSEGLEQAALVVAASIIGFQSAPLEDAVGTDDAVAFVLGELDNAAALVRGAKALVAGLVLSGGDPPADQANLRQRGYSDPE